MSNQPVSCILVEVHSYISFSFGKLDITPLTLLCLSDKWLNKERCYHMACSRSALTFFLVHYHILTYHYKRIQIPMAQGRWNVVRELKRFPTETFQRPPMVISRWKPLETVWNKWPISHWKPLLAIGNLDNFFYNSKPITFQPYHFNIHFIFTPIPIHSTHI